MRLSGDGEQPLDKFIRFKNNIDLWYTEMIEEGLTRDEILIMESHVKTTYGVTDSQEALMLLTMDPRISDYNLSDANKFRKAVAKQDQKKLKEQHEVFIKAGLATGSRREFLNYIWEFQFKPSFGYAFSRPHVAGYTLILMIELNICLKYTPLYWKTACLSVNSGAYGGSDSGSDYGAIAKATGDMKGTITVPDINISRKSFTPNEETGKILFGLKPIIGIGDDDAEVIMANRPYKNFDDFVERVINTNLLTPKKAIILVKAGAFDLIETRDRKELLIAFTRSQVPSRLKLTMSQLPALLGFASKNENLKEELDLYYFRQTLFGRKKVKMTKDIEKYFIANFGSEVVYNFSDSGTLQIDKKSFDKMYNDRIIKLREWLEDPATVAQFNRQKMSEYWIENCLGNKESWEMETILFYSDKHELDYYPLDDYFTIADFSSLPADPVPTSWKSYRGRKIPQYAISVIAGTVVDKNKKRGIAYIATQTGVVPIKLGKDKFLHYDKKVVDVRGDDKVVLDESWFVRGTKLVCIGFRRGEDFALRKGNGIEHTVMKILGQKNGSIHFKAEKSSL